MRIRSIKPEFWRSDDIARLDLADRLLFIGLWSYVDDNGVGVDKLASIAADLFAADVERDAPETFQRVSGGLRKLSEAGLIARYEVESKPYLAVTGWVRHQRVEKPAKPRYPGPDQAIETVSGDAPEDLRTSSRLEQGNRGTEEQREGARGARGTRLPKDWHPGDAEMAKAAAKSPALNVERELEKFRDWWAAASGAKGVKADWLATWRNWCRSGQERAEARGWKPQPAVVPEGEEWAFR